MKQMTWRADDVLVEAVQRAAKDAGRSANEWVTTVLRTATDPNFAGSESERVRDRLAAAGLLERPARYAARRPDPERVAAARRRAGRGTSLASLVDEGRGERLR